MKRTHLENDNSEKETLKRTMTNQKKQMLKEDTSEKHKSENEFLENKKTDKGNSGKEDNLKKYNYEKGS